MSGQVSIDTLKTQESHLDLADRQLPTDFNLGDYVLSQPFDDVMLLEFCDLDTDETGNDYVLRGGIAVPVAQITNMWRMGKVLLKGPNVKQCEIGDVVSFPSNMGIPITNLDVEGYGKVKNGIFLNEQRMFAICKSKKSLENA